MTETATKKLAETEKVKIKPSTGEMLTTAIDPDGDLWLHAERTSAVGGRQASVWLDDEGVGDFVAALDRFGVLKRFGYEKPKPPLPTGLGAIVRDKETGARYLLADMPDCTLPWRRVRDHGGVWVETAAVEEADYEILSEGVAA